MSSHSSQNTEFTHDKKKKRKIIITFVKITKLKQRNKAKTQDEGLPLQLIALRCLALVSTHSIIQWNKAHLIFGQSRQPIYRIGQLKIQTIQDLANHRSQCSKSITIYYTLSQYGSSSSALAVVANKRTRVHESTVASL